MLLKCMCTLNLPPLFYVSDGGAMYYVNCTAEPVLCRNHNIRGFPTIAAYRGLGWMDASSCMTTSSQKLFNKFVRVDYHGVLKVGNSEYSKVYIFVLVDLIYMVISLSQLGKERKCLTIQFSGKKKSFLQLK